MGRKTRRPRAAWALPALGFAGWLCILPCTSAQEPADEQLDRAKAEARLNEVLEDIDRLRSRLDASRSEHRKEQDRLREIDLDIQEANRGLRDLQAQAAEHQQELDRLETRREQYLGSLAQRMDDLAQQLRAAYAGGRQSRMKLVLNQDDPLQLGRMLAYYDYFNRAQVRRIGTLREALKTLESVRQSIDREMTRLADLAREQQDLLDRLQLTRERRNDLLAALADQIGSEEARLQELERNRKDLETLIERLSDVLADIPADLGSRLGLAQQKGRLPMPLQGPVLHAFGQSHSGGLHWQGWLIGADPGAEVGAVAYGRVAFADWLRGYGLMLIIDHGQGYMSLYGHNETLLQEVGAWVEPGEIISVVGSNPGKGQGLYFELRQSGKAIDPAAWLDR
jgi:septal ring factor EnvC (AmiA/AmiB activator)